MSKWFGKCREAHKKTPLCHYSYIIGEKPYMCLLIPFSFCWKKLIVGVISSILYIIQYIHSGYIITGEKPYKCVRSNVHPSSQVTTHPSISSGEKSDKCARSNVHRPGQVTTHLSHFFW